jgi:hypothetical protein
LTATLRSPVDSETEATTEDIEDEASVTVGQELREEAAEEEVKSVVEPSSLGRRRKRERVVAKAPTRLHSDEEDLGFMQEALAEARKGAKRGEVPVGAVLVHKKKIIARFHNQ